MANIKENYELMFTAYPDIVNIIQLKEMLGIGITLIPPMYSVFFKRVYNSSGTANHIWAGVLVSLDDSKTSFPLESRTAKTFIPWIKRPKITLFALDVALTNKST